MHAATRHLGSNLSQGPPWDISPGQHSTLETRSNPDSSENGCRAKPSLASLSAILTEESAGVRVVCRRSGSVQFLPGATRTKKVYYLSQACTVSFGLRHFFRAGFLIAVGCCLRQRESDNLARFKSRRFLCRWNLRRGSEFLTVRNSPENLAPLSILRQGKAIVPRKLLASLAGKVASDGDTTHVSVR